MTPEHTALVARLEGDVTLGDVNAAIAAIRALAGEKDQARDMMHEWKILADRTQAEVAALKTQNAALVRELEQALHP